MREGGSIRENEEVEVDKSLAGAKLVGRFNIPVGTAQVLNSAPRSVLWLKYSPNDKTFRLVHGNAINGLNSAEFRAVISNVDGETQASWEPRLDAAEEAKRGYAILGRESLTEGVWTSPANSAHRYYKVNVEMLGKQ